MLYFRALVGEALRCFRSMQIYNDEPSRCPNGKMQGQISVWVRVCDDSMVTRDKFELNILYLRRKKTNGRTENLQGQHIVGSWRQPLRRRMEYTCASQRGIKIRSRQQGPTKWVSPSKTFMMPSVTGNGSTPEWTRPIDTCSIDRTWVRLLLDIIAAICR